MALRDDSRYLLTEVVQQVDPISGRPVRPAFVDLRERVSSFDSTDRFIVSDGVMGWDGLSLKYLADARHYWAIADLSDVVDPFEELEDGRTVTIPSAARLQFSILPGERGS